VSLKGQSSLFQIPDKPVTPGPSPDSDVQTESKFVDRSPRPGPAASESDAQAHDELARGRPAPHDVTRAPGRPPSPSRGLGPVTGSFKFDSDNEPRCLPWLHTDQHAAAPGRRRQNCDTEKPQRRRIGAAPRPAGPARAGAPLRPRHPRRRPGAAGRVGPRAG
jgi:hypothetical protein